jgi:hypothetical protein
VAILVLLVVAVGPWVFLSADGAFELQGTAAPQADPVAESKRVFDERRRAYESARKIYATPPANAATGRRWLIVYQPPINADRNKLHRRTQEYRNRLLGRNID